ncbi:MAG: hypothetical protein DWQ10_09195 [Calditrichaeota bacterium]|nr:MAG: hypothetical protein DWQ10_09195 [Calditrichota bacterium]
MHHGRHTKILLISLLSLFISTALNAQLPPGKVYKIAVLPFASDIAGPDALKPAYALMQGFKSNQQLRPVNMQTVLNALSSKRIGQTNCSNIACARKLGYALRSHVVVHGQINSTYSGYLVTIQATHTKSGKVLNRISRNIPGSIDDLSTAMSTIANMLIRPQSAPVANGSSRRSTTISENSSKKKWALIGLALAGGVGVGILATQGGDNPPDDNPPPTPTQLPGPPPLSGGN